MIQLSSGGSCFFEEHLKITGGDLRISEEVRKGALQKIESILDNLHNPQQKSLERYKCEMHIQAKEKEAQSKREESSRIQNQESKKAGVEFVLQYLKKIPTDA